MGNNQHPSLTREALELVASRFKVLGDPTRLSILQQLRKGERTVSELVATLALAQSSVSKHLKTLRQEGLVSRRKVGPSAIYSIADPIVWTLCDAVCNSLAQQHDRRTDHFESTGIKPTGT